MEKHIYLTKKEALKIIERLPDDAMLMFSFDFDNGEGISDSGKYIDKPTGKQMIGEAKTRIFSGNQYMSQLNLYNIFQPDVKNIRPQGVMKTILLRGIKENHGSWFWRKQSNVCSDFVLTRTDVRNILSE